MEFYTPKQGFDEQLLSSVPKKVYEWVMSHGIDPDEIANIGEVKWSKGEDTSRIIFRSSVIEWTGAVMEPTSIRTNVKQFAEASKNLSSFVAFEKEIYGEVEEFIERHLNEQQLLQTLQA